MKINYITDIRLPTVRASGYAIMKMCEKFSENGVTVDLVVPARKNNEDVENPFNFYKIKKNFSIRKVFSIDLLGRTIKFGEIFYWVDFFVFLFFIKLTNRIDKDDIIYTRDYLIPIVFSKKYFICLELHNIPSNKFLFNLVTKNIKLFVVLNKYIKDELIKSGISENKIIIASSGVDIKEFDIDVNKEEARKKLNLPILKKIVVYTGHLYSWKGVDTLVQTARNLPDIIFVFVGGVEPEITEFENKYNDLKNIIIIPFMSRSIIPLYLKSADILVLPNSKKENISKYYTSPLKLFEYMASAKPIIASSLPSIREILDESNSVLVESDSVEALTQSIDNLISNNDLQESISKKAKQDVVKYDWYNRAKIIVEEIIKKTDEI